MWIPPINFKKGPFGGHHIDAGSCPQTTCEVVTEIPGMISMHPPMQVVHSVSQNNWGTETMIQKTPRKKHHTHTTQVDATKWEPEKRAVSRGDIATYSCGWTETCTMWHG